VAKEEKNKKVAKKKSAKEASVQAYLEIAEARDDILIMKDGSLRAVLMVSSLNFDLKSLGEQEAIILGYQNFLNSLDFPIQILIRSKKLDLDSYIFQLDERRMQETNEFIKSQIEQYSNFIKNLLEVSNIMDKKFYIIVPFYTEGAEAGIKKIGLFQKIANTIHPTWQEKAKEEEFNAGKMQLLERVGTVASGFTAVGLNAAQLSTINLIELFYEIYNLDTAQREKLMDVDTLTTDFVQ